MAAAAATTVVVVVVMGVVCMRFNHSRRMQVSALASCARLRKLYLHRTRVADVSVLSLLPDLVVSQ